MRPLSQKELREQLSIINNDIILLKKQLHKVSTYLKIIFVGFIVLLTTMFI